MEFICVFCESEMTADQIVCCGTYKGKMEFAEFQEVYEWVIG
jgi:hypothetical protein